jgi:hypothetical protein
MQSAAMTNQTSFIRFTAIACMASVITTMGIHAFFNFDAPTLEERVLLFQNPWYIGSHWWVIVHCLLVIVSMWGFYLVQHKKSKEFVGLGFIFFVVFAITEIFRQLLVLFYLNGMRETYMATNSESIKDFLANSMNNFGLFSYALFGLFILAFAIGNLCYGLSLIGETGLSKMVGVLLLIWSAGVFVALGNEFWEATWLSAFLAPFNLYYQPMIRALIGIWLWKAAQSINKPAYG